MYNCNAGCKYKDTFINLSDHLHLLLAFLFSSYFYEQEVELMKLVADCHLHTVASGHAYSTITEYAKEASEKGLELIGMTDHGPRMPGGPHRFHFENLKAIPEYMYNVEILKGIEANIIDYDGTLDTDGIDLSELDIVISSFHNPCIKPTTKEEITKAYIGSMKNKYVNIIGHPDRTDIDCSEFAKAAAYYGVLVEVNNNSLKPNTFRSGSEVTYEEILEECYKNKIYIIINTDSHFHTNVGEFDEACECVRKFGYPKELIANLNVERLKERLYLRRD